MAVPMPSGWHGSSPLARMAFVKSPALSAGEADATGGPRTQRRLLQRLLPPSAGGLVVGSALLAILPAVVRRVGDPDYWWHYRTGKYIVDNVAIPPHELYTYTVAGNRWWAQEYGYQVVVYVLDRLGGLLAVSLALGAATWAAMLMILARIRVRGGSALVTAAAIVLGAGAGLAVWGPVTQVVDIAFVSLQMWLVERFLAGRGRAVYAMPALTVLWANLHGGVIFGPFLLGIVAAAVTAEGWWLRQPQRLAVAKRLWLLTFAQLVAMSVTPDGPALFGYIWSTQFSVAAASFVREWQPPNLTHTDMRGLEVMVMLGLTGLAWRRLRAHDIALLVVTTVLALQSVRHIAIYVVVATPILVWEWSGVMPLVGHRLARIPWPDRRRMTAVAAAVLVLAAVAGVGATARNLVTQSESTRRNYPVQTSDWLASHPEVGARMFNEFGWGGYLANRFYGIANRRVFIYGATGIVGDPLLRKYAAVVGLESNWEQVLDSYGVDYIVFDLNQPLTTALEISQQWTLAHADSVAVVYVRRHATAVRADARRSTKAPAPAPRARRH